MQNAFSIGTASGIPMDELTRIKLLKTSILSYHVMDHDYPEFLQQTFAGLCDYLNTHLPNAEAREADTKAHGLSVQHKGKSEDDILLSMNAEQITAYLAATGEAKKWKSKLHKQLKKTKCQHASTASSSDDDSAMEPNTRTPQRSVKSWKPTKNGSRKPCVNSQSPPGGSVRKHGTPYVRLRPGEESDTKSTLAPPEPRGQRQFVRQENPGSSTQSTTHHHGDGAAFNTNLHAIDNSQLHDSSASERIMSQSNSDPDPESTDKRDEEHEIKIFSLDKRGDCLDNFITCNIAGFKHRPSYE